MTTEKPRTNQWVWTSNHLPTEGRQVEGLLKSGDVAIMVHRYNKWHFTNGAIATEECKPLLWRYATVPSKRTDILIITFQADQLPKYKEAIEKCRDANLYITAAKNGLSGQYALRCRGRVNLSQFWSIFNGGSKL
jgi:hypothetical protein